MWPLCCLSVEVSWFRPLIEFNFVKVTLTILDEDCIRFDLVKMDGFYGGNLQT